MTTNPAATAANLRASPDCLLNGGDAGLFVSRGRGIHPDRTMDVFALLFVRSGALWIAEDNRRFTVGADEALVLWPGRRHVGTRPYADDLSFYWLTFLPAPRKPPVGNATDAAVLVPQYARVQRPAELVAAFDRYLADQESGRLTAVSRHALTLLILHEVADGRPVAPEGDGEGASAIALHAMAYIRTHFYKPLSATAVADELGYSVEYLGRLFRQAYGHTVTEAIHQHRIASACRRLLVSDATLEEVARGCGFSDAGYFRRLFRRYRGMTPGEYRRRAFRPYINTE